MPWWLLVPIIAGLIAAVALNWDSIIGWIIGIKQQVPNAKYAEIIKERLASGKVRVYAGVFAPRFLGLGTKQVANKLWEVEKLDSTADQKLGRGNFVRIQL